MNRHLLIMALGVCIGAASPAWAQVDTTAAKKKVLAKRAAEADAYRKLAEAIKGLQITSDTYVKDFVAESDEIRAAMDEFIRGVRLGEPRFYDDGSCEVPAEVTLAKTIETIKEVHTRHYHGNRVTGKDIEKMETRVERKVIEVVGMGAPREDLPPGLPEGVEEQLGAPPAASSPAIPDLWKAVGAQGRLMAIRAAEVDAKRKLLERIKGLRITSDTIVRDFVAESDEITARAQGKVIGATIVRTYLHHDEPIAEVTVSVPVESVIEVIKELHTRSIQGDSIKGTDITNITRAINSKTFEATGMGIPPQGMLMRYSDRMEDEEDRLPPWAMKPLSVKGSGVAPEGKAGTAQGRLMAARAAELDAKRRLGEFIDGLQIQSTTTVRDFVTEHDEIRSHMDSIIVEAIVEKTTYDGEMAEVTVSMPGMRVWEIVHERMRVSSMR